MVNQQQAVYRITLAERLDIEWDVSLRPMTVATDSDGHSVLTGPVIDQPALRGLLNRLWDLNLTVLSLTRVAYDEESRDDNNICTDV